jgi:DNA replication protein DnaC
MLTQQDGAKSLERAIRRYARPTLLVIDELGYLSYDNRYADLLDRLVHHCEIAKIDGESYRLKDHRQDPKNRTSGC